MNHKTHKRSPMISKAVAAAAALVLGGGGVVAVNVYANAGTSNGDSGSQEQSDGQGQNVATIECPEVVDELAEVPDQARSEVDRNLALLDNQIVEAYKRLADSERQMAQDPNFAKNAILGPLADKRRATIDRIATAIGRVAEKPQGLNDLSACDVRQVEDGDQNQNNDGEDNNQDQNQDQNQDNNQEQDQNQDNEQDIGNGEGQAGNGPSPDDFVDITTVQPNVDEPQAQGNASSGTFTTECGRNENGKRNSDNVIAAPGVENGAHHMHDYVGNQDTNAFSSDDSLARGETTCENPEDQSTHYWPVVRLQNGQQEADANAPGGGQDGNVGQIQTPSTVSLTFQGSPVGDVVEMPRFLRIITGDAKSFINGDANANASWSCTGFEDRQLKDKYPLCPEGSQVVRTFKFQSCWDGQNTDSANHRTHVDFANGDGSCDNGFQAIPQLVQRLTYDLPAGEVFAVDSFPEQLHKPITDHSDFINVMSEDLMSEAVSCINEGRDCG